MLAVKLYDKEEYVDFLGWDYWFDFGLWTVSTGGRKLVVKAENVMVIRDLTNLHPTLWVGRRLPYITLYPVAGFMYIPIGERAQSDVEDQEATQVLHIQLRHSVVWRDVKVEKYKGHAL